jgi:hypothetical protein
MHGGEVYGAEANAPTSGARTQLPAWLVIVVAELCRGATLRAAAASLVYAAAATSAAATMVILVIVFSTGWQKPSKLGSWNQVR